MSRPVVSVCITTYFHEQYIAEAIDSVLAQRTSFPIEICISDDCSRDKTVEILLDYSKKYNFIKVNINKNNVGLSKNMFLAREMATGDFLVMLSGDDYYIDRNKLQKQFDFLCKHPSFFGVATTVETRYDDSKKTIRKFPGIKYRNKEFTLEMFLSGHNFPLSGIMYRNVLRDPKYYKLLSTMPSISPYIDDVTDSIFLLQIGKIFVLSDSCTAYRVRRTIKSDHNFNSINQGLSSYNKHIEMLNNLYSFYNGEMNLYHRYKKVLISYWLKSFLCKQHKKFKEMYETIPDVYKKRHLYACAVFWAIILSPIKVFRRIWG